jgi:hypothetical protein
MTIILAEIMVMVPNKLCLSWSAKHSKRKREIQLLNNLEEVDALLKIGAGKAAKVANGVLSRVREN